MLAFTRARCGVPSWSWAWGRLTASRWRTSRCVLVPVSMVSLPICERRRVVRDLGIITVFPGLIALSAAAGAVSIAAE